MLDDYPLKYFKFCREQPDVVIGVHTFNHAIKGRLSISIDRDICLVVGTKEERQGYDVHQRSYEIDVSVASAQGRKCKMVFKRQSLNVSSGQRQQFCFR